LPRKDQQRLLTVCESVDIHFSDALYEPQQKIRHVYFPCDSFVSFVRSMERGERVELGMIGSEGMLGIPVALGVGIAPFYAIVQGTGSSLRMKADVFRKALEEIPALRRRINRYIYVLLNQSAQNATCLRFHLVEQRLARWLLMSQDRAKSDKLHLTQEFLSAMLGVRRVGVSNAASSLHERKLITYSRGEITILDRQGLIGAACPCYEADNYYYDSIMNKS
jgi:CRP-like cAMP-binding protein